MIFQVEASTGGNRQTFLSIAIYILAKALSCRQFRTSAGRKFNTCPGAQQSKDVDRIFLNNLSGKCDLGCLHCCALLLMGKSGILLRNAYLPVSLFYRKREESMIRSKIGNGIALLNMMFSRTIMIA